MNAVGFNACAFQYAKDFISFFLVGYQGLFERPAFGIYGYGNQRVIGIGMNFRRSGKDD